MCSLTAHTNMHIHYSCAHSLHWGQALQSQTYTHEYTRTNRSYVPLTHCIHTRMRIHLSCTHSLHTYKHAHASIMCVLTALGTSSAISTGPCTLLLPSPFFNVLTNLKTSTNQFGGLDEGGGVLGGGCWIQGGGWLLAGWWWLVKLVLIVKKRCLLHSENCTKFMIRMVRLEVWVAIYKETNAPNGIATYSNKYDHANT